LGCTGASVGGGVRRTGRLFDGDIRREPIAFLPDGFDNHRPSRIRFDLLAYTGNTHVNSTIDYISFAANLRQQISTRDDLLWTGAKNHQHREFAAGQLDFNTGWTEQLQSASDIEQFREGVQLVFNKLRKVLKQRGLKEMNSIGTEFNPDIHEAITEIPAPSADMKGKILDQVETGYYLNDKIIRFAKVVVGK